MSQYSLYKKNIRDLIGNTPVLEIPSLSRLSNCKIVLKCENLNPGGSIKDRAALQMISDAIDSGELRPGMTIVEGTAGNTGIGLSLVGRSLGYDVKVVMPKGQAKSKEDMLRLFGADLLLVDPCPFKDPKHFYHTARRIAEEDPKKFWWANQFENLSNYKAHYRTTGPELLEQLNSNIDFLVASAGTGGTIGGTSVYLKENIPGITTVLVDPRGSGLCSYVKTGDFKSEGGSITEGIGIMRLVNNFAQAKVDAAITLDDQDLVTIAHYLRDTDGIVLGLSAALNVAAALKIALTEGPGKTIVTFWCDSGERSAAKLYNRNFLRENGLEVGKPLQTLIDAYKK